MTTSSKLDFSKQMNSSGYVPEDKDQALVQTPFGRGTVVRTRRRDNDANPMREIILNDWIQSDPSRGPNKPSMLYSNQTFPSVPAEVGSDVVTPLGRGKVLEIRSDSSKTHVVRLSSWRLAGRSTVTCFLASKDVQVVIPYKIYDMNVFEKIEHASELKVEATTKFQQRDFKGALELYAKAVDAVRYIQHGPESSNEVRADLVVLMVTCSNNSGTCSLQLKDWDLAGKYGINALALIDALEKKKDSSKILQVVHRDGYSDSQVFGTWKIKSLLLIAKSQLRKKDEPLAAIQTLKKALEAVSMYKQEDDAMFKQLLTQEKELRKIYAECTQQIKADRKKERLRAQAMFRGGKETRSTDQQNGTAKASSPKRSKNSTSESSQRDLSPRSVADVSSATCQKSTISKTKPDDDIVLKKHVSFADGTTPGDQDGKSRPFFEEHMEALLLVAGFGLGCWLVSMAWKRR